MNILAGQNIPHFKGDILGHASGSIQFLYNMSGPKYKQNNMGHKISRHYNVQYIKFLKSDPIFICSSE